MADLQSNINNIVGDLGASKLKKYEGGTSPMVSGSQFWNDLYNTAVNVGNSITNSFKNSTTQTISNSKPYISPTSATYTQPNIKIPNILSQGTPVNPNVSTPAVNTTIGYSPYVAPAKVDTKQPVTTDSYGSQTLNTNDLGTNVDNAYSSTNTQNQNNVNASEQSSTANTNVDTANESNFDKYLAKIGTVSQVNESDIRAKQEKDAGLAEKTKISNDLKAKIDANTASAEVAKRTLEQQAGGKDVTTGFLGRQQQEIDRQVAIQNSPLTAQYQIAKGDVEGAQKTVDSAVKSEYDYQKSQYDYQIKLIDKAYEYANEQDKAAIAAQKEKTDNAYKASQALWQKKLELLSLAKSSNDYSQVGNIISANNENSLTSLAGNLASSGKDSDVLTQYVKDVQATPENFSTVPTAYKEMVAEKLGGATLPEWSGSKFFGLASSDMKKEFESVGITQADYESVKEIMNSGSTLSSIISASQGISDQAKQTFEKYLQLKS